jgi:hypothetical protein
MGARTHRPAAALLATVAMVGTVLAGCSSADDPTASTRSPKDAASPTPTGSTPSSTTTPSPSPTGSSPAPSPSRSQRPSPTPTVSQRAELPWLPFGPASPNDPVEQASYPVLRARDCAGFALIEGSGGIWQAAETVCFAMAGAGEETWAQAEGEFAAAMEAPPAEDCWFTAVADAVGRVLEYHREHPGDAPVATVSNEGVACPLILDHLSRQNEFGALVDLGEVSPCGGEQIYLFGRVLESTTVTLDGKPVEKFKRPGQLYWYYFVAPVAAPDRADNTVDVRAFGPDGPLPGPAVSFTYAADTGACSGSATPDPNEAP